MDTDLAVEKELDFNAPKFMDFNDANSDDAAEDYFFGGKTTGTTGTSDSGVKGHDEVHGAESEKVESMVTEDVETTDSDDVDTAVSKDVETEVLKVETVVSHKIKTVVKEVETVVTEKVETITEGEEIIKSEEIEKLEVLSSEESDGTHPEDESSSLAERPIPPNLVSSFNTELKGLGGCIRQSPRLADIAKAMRRHNAQRRSLDGKRQSLDNSFGVANDFHGRKNRIKQNGPKRGPQIKTLNKTDEATLASIAEIKQKMTRIKKDKESSKKLGPTKVQEFHFATDSRVKNPQKNIDGDEKEFVRSLRSSTCSQSSKENRGPTIPKPFNLTESHKTQKSGDDFISMAEKNLKFFTGTPQRFRTKKFSDSSNESTRASHAPTKLTQPLTPKLQSKARLRGIQHPTREEQEQQELDEIHKKKFKAQPLNKKVFDSPASGYKVKKQPTIPQPFNITSSKKYESCGNLKGMGVRSESLCSVPYGGVPNKLEMGSTKPKPFSFDNRDKEMMKKKEEKIQKFIEDEKKLREFQANPMPTFESVSGLHERKPQEPTAPKPFSFKIDQRGEAKKEKWQNELEEKERHEEEVRQFKAQPCAVTHKVPFIPQKSNKPCTEISGFTLNTEERSKEREEFDKVRQQKEDELLAMKRELEERKASEEADEIARIRKETVHKANPIRRYKTVEIKPSSHPPTYPISPKFHTDKRIK